MLQSVRLLTLTGAGGSGKTRLAIEGAKEAIDDFSDGVHFVELAAVNDANLVLPTITRRLGIHENPATSTFDSLGQFLANESALLILDSFERVIDAAPALAELLGICPRLKILVTSRASLRLRGEHEFAVPPMDVPAGDRLPSPSDVDQYEALSLFVARASAASFDFRLTEDNVADVIDICRRLDGLPLAIELAAARLKLLPLTTLRDRLSSRLDLLKGGARDLPARQQTLRALIDWDYEMLTDEEQAIFRRLSVCSGGFSLEARAVEADMDDLRVLDLVESLAAKSLLRSVESELGEPRARMLQTIREYALDVLIGSGEADEVRRRHALFYLELAEQADASLRGPDQVKWLERLETELDNMRAALAWAHEQLDSSTELRLSAALAQFWALRGHINEGRRWIETSLGRSTGVASLHRAQLLTGAATLARARGAYQQASTLLQECLELQRSAGDDSGVAIALKDLANIKADQEDTAGARSLYEASLELSRRGGHELVIAMTLNNLGYLAQLDGETDRAIASYEDSIAVSRRLNDKQGIARTLMNLGSVVREKDDLERAAAHLQESLLLWRELEDKWDVPDCLEEIANVRFERQMFEGAASLYAAADSIRAAIGAKRSPLEHEEYERRVAMTRVKLGDKGFETAWARGRALDMNGAIDFALADER